MGQKRRSSGQPPKKQSANKSNSGKGHLPKSDWPLSKSSEEPRRDSIDPLPKDWSEFIGLLIFHKVRFLVVGGHAVSVNARPRATADLDIWLDRSLENVRHLKPVLEDFGFPMSAREYARFSRQNQMASLGVEPLRIDLLSSVTGIEFNEAWKTKLLVQWGPHTLYFLGREALLKNKMATGRTKDLFDIELLRQSSEK